MQAHRKCESCHECLRPIPFEAFRLVCNYGVKRSARVRLACAEGRFSGMECKVLVWSDVAMLMPLWHSYYVSGVTYWHSSELETMGDMLFNRHCHTKRRDLRTPILQFLFVYVHILPLHAEVATELDIYNPMCQFWIQSA